MSAKNTIARVHAQVSNYLSDFTGLAEPTREFTDEAAAKLDSGEAQLHDLAKEYKQAPHSAGSVFYKYLTHRFNNVDKYDSKTTGETADTEFCALHTQKTKVTPRHLNNWLSLNPHLLEDAVSHRDALHGAIKHGIGLNIRKINGEPHVALTRGLDSKFMNKEMALSSFSDLPSSPFGEYQHNVWVPLKDVWYGFPVSPGHARGVHGHENEWVVSNSGQRYQARDVDVKTSLFANVPDASLPMDLFVAGGDKDETAAQMMREGRLPVSHAQNLHAMGLLGPRTLEAALSSGVPITQFANSRLVPATIALPLALQWLDSAGSGTHLALSNPNLTENDLSTIVDHPAFLVNPDDTVRVASHPNFNESVAARLIEAVMKKGAHSILPIIAKCAKTPLLSLHKALVAGLDSGEDSGWHPEWAIARCFSMLPEKSKLTPESYSSAFNNSQNSERYLRALATFFGKNEDRASNASNVFHKFLTGARMSDTTVGTLVDMTRNGTPLAGVTSQDMEMLMQETARFNPQLSARQMALLADSYYGAMGLLDRKSLPLAPQLAIAEMTLADQDARRAVNVLSCRSDLEPKAADVLLHRLVNLNDNEYAAGPAYEVARNHNIPENIIKKYIKTQNPNEQDTLDKVLVMGLQNRTEDGHIVLPLPPGGAE